MLCLRCTVYRFGLKWWSHLYELFIMIIHVCQSQGGKTVMHILNIPYKVHQTENIQLKALLNLLVRISFCKRWIILNFVKEISLTTLVLFWCPFLSFYWYNRPMIKLQMCLKQYSIGNRNPYILLIFCCTIPITIYFHGYSFVMP